MKRNIILIFLLCMGHTIHPMSSTTANKLLQDGISAIKDQNFDEAQRIVNQLRGARATRQANELQKALEIGLRKGFAGILRNLPDQIAQWNQQRQELAAQVRDLTAQIDIKTRQGQDATADRDQLQALLQQQQQQLQQQADQANAVQRQLETRINDLLAQAQATDEQKADLANQIADLNRLTAHQQDIIRDSRTDADALRQQVVDKDSQLAKCQQDLTTLQTQATQGSADQAVIQQLQQEKATLTTERNNLQLSLVNKDNQLIQCQSDLRDLKNRPAPGPDQSALQQLQQKLDTLQQEIATKDAQLTKCQQDLAALQAQPAPSGADQALLQQLQADKAALEKDKSRLNESLKNQAASLDACKEDLKSKTASFENASKLAQANAENLRKKIKDLQDQLDAANAQASTNVNETIKKLTDENKSLTDQIRSKDNGLDLCTKALNNCNKLKNSAESNLESMKSALAEKNKALIETQNALKEATAANPDLDALRIQLAECNKDKERLIAETSKTLTDTITAKNSEIQDLRNSIAQLQTQIDKGAGTVDDEVIRALKAELTRAQDSENEFKGKLKQCEAALDAASRDAQKASLLQDALEKSQDNLTKVQEEVKRLTSAQSQLKAKIRRSLIEAINNASLSGVIPATAAAALVANLNTVIDQNQ